MLFKHPELLWAFFLLLIPILIHLFQLRKFKKTPFTNVKILKKVVAESRRSNTLKKWLLLFTRLLLLSALIVAFAQPFIPGKSALKNNNIVIYLDNSLSMQANMGTGTLLENMVQQLLKSVPPETNFSIFTNDQTFEEVTLADIKNDLLALPYSTNQLQLNDIYIKANTLFPDTPNTQNDLVLISDFQKSILSQTNDSLYNINRYVVQSVPKDLLNIAIDSAFTQTISSENLDLSCFLTSSLKIENTPVSLYNGDNLIAKTSASFNEDLHGEVHFTIPAKEVINGKILISDSGLQYDNQLYFNLNRQEKIKVMSIGETPSDYLERIYTEESFHFSSFSLKALNYSLIASQNLIILNELNTIPLSLQNTLQAFRKAGGHLVIIPNNRADINEYNTFIKTFSNSKFVSSIGEERKVSQISFAHPLFENVFNKEVSNFQYPSVNGYYKTTSSLPKILSYQNGEPFLIGANGLYLFTAPISLENSNFTQSPLIVPTFYNMGMSSLKMPRLYEMVGNKITLDIPISLGKDQILKVSNENQEFIPYQQSYGNKTTLTFDDYPTSAGIYSITHLGKDIKNISFNLPREESKLDYMNNSDLQGNIINNDVSALFQTIQKDNSINELWKWFVILALAFILIEVLIQKYLK
ncbi:hypothetical protein EHW67_16635 [Arenibacter aquaticus]|uniref:Aerotolerance regulator N-terminal domain-containing protein n=1 Tax=Arenibacter aquaticus TaxID=2489054 RepID=A0A430JY87_9FLAO|nr:BatA domain-containing protein [Arenibacter aquaticus]RTE51834.1 hypothetical protein EHW67_16635 [Arenibacter aquaticus]